MGTPSKAMLNFVVPAKKGKSQQTVRKDFGSAAKRSLIPLPVNT